VRRYPAYKDSKKLGETKKLGTANLFTITETRELQGYGTFFDELCLIMIVA
jgi:hypothetical protein